MSEMQEQLSDLPSGLPDLNAAASISLPGTPDITPDESVTCPVPTQAFSKASVARVRHTLTHFRTSAIAWVNTHRRESAAALILLMMGTTLLDANPRQPNAADSQNAADLIDVEQLLAEFPAPAPTATDGETDQTLPTPVTGEGSPDMDAGPFALPPAPPEVPMARENTLPPYASGSQPAAMADAFRLPPPIPDRLPSSPQVDSAANYGDSLPPAAIAAVKDEPPASSPSMVITPNSSNLPLRVSPIRFRGGIQPIR